MEKSVVFPEPFGPTKPIRSFRLIVAVTSENKTRGPKESEAILRKAAMDAQAVVTDARKIAKELTEKQTHEAAAQGAAILEKARQSIELERKKILAEVRSEIARLVTVTTAKVLSKELSAEEKTRYADAASRELTNV